MAFGGMLPASAAAYLDDFLATVSRAHEEGDPTWDAELRAQDALPLRERLRQLFTIPPPGPRPVMMPPAIRRDERQNTILPQQQELAYQLWRQRNAPFAHDEDYDLRGAFKAGVKPDGEGALPPGFRKAGMLSRGGC